MHCSPSVHPTLCPQGSVCARTALQTCGDSFLAQDLQDEIWAFTVKIHWHEAAALIENFQGSLTLSSVSGRKGRQKHVITFQPLSSRSLPLQINPGLNKDF